MCSVSFVPLEDGFILTSNRDEKIGRLTYEPQLYFENNALLLYPKDANAGGTWIVAKENNTCIVLLNGAFENHQKKAQYRKSRGLILKEIITAEDPFFHFSKMNLKDIEPFTLIIFFKATLTDVKWDGVRKHILPKSTTQPHFWSSATLYNQAQRQLRSQWFKEFYASKSTLTAATVLWFHKNSHSENTEFGLVINREDQTKTLSITQLVLNHQKIEMTYIDRIKNCITAPLTF